MDARWNALLIGGVLVAACGGDGSSGPARWTAVPVAGLSYAAGLAGNVEGTFVDGTASDTLLPAIRRYDGKGGWSIVPTEVTATGSIAAMATDAAGNLVAVINESFARDTAVPYTTSVRRYLLAADDWEVLGHLNGYATALAIDPDTDVVYTTAQVEALGLGTLGLLVAYAPDGTEERLVNGSAGWLSAVAIDGDGRVYVAGTNHEITYLPEYPQMASIWRYDGLDDDDLPVFTRIDMPYDIPAIDTLASDGSGTIYVEGTTSDYVDHVWTYTGGAFTDTGLAVPQIEGIATSAAGAVFAVGLDAQFRGQVWRYDADRQGWTSLEVPGSHLMAGVYVDRTGRLSAVGGDRTNVPTMWVYTPTVH